MTLQELRQHKQRITSLTQRYGASNIRVFGSVSRDSATHSSDVDFLIDWDNRHSLLDRIAMQQDLSELLGITVDVVVARNLHWTIRDSVLQQAKPL